MTYDDLIERFVTWAQGTPDVRAALMLGSRARTDHPADEWADLDLLMFVQDPDPYVQSAAWAEALAPCWLSFIERSGDNKSWERRTLYEGGLDVDVALNPEEWLDGLLQLGSLPPDVAGFIGGGVKVLVDKDGKLGRILALPRPEPPSCQPPTQQEFLNAVNDFWYHTLWSTKHLRRGEVWRGIFCVDTYLKGLVCRMLEWHALARRGTQAGVWPHGRFLEEWADPRAVQALHSAFAHYEAGDIARALQATMTLYRWLEDETAAVWGYTSPRQGEDQAARCTLELLEGWIEK